jgi:hypothetical protein
MMGGQAGMMPGQGMMGAGNSGIGPGGMMAGGGGGGMGMGCGGDGQCPGPVFMSLLQQNSKIQREYKHTDSGIESLTQSDDPQVAALIKTHVQQMHALMDSCAKGKCSHTPRYFDPLFRAVYANADKIDMKITNTDKGVRVLEDGKGDAAKLLVQAHAAVVSKFVANGFNEHHKTHEVPAAAKAGLTLNH